MNNNFIIEQVGYCATCLGVELDGDFSGINIDTDMKVLDTVTIDHVKRNCSSKKLGAWNIPLHKDDYDYYKVKYCYDNIMKWYNMYNRYIIK